MERKLDQIEMDVGNIGVASTDEEDVAQVVHTTKPVKQPPLETLQIDGGEYSSPEELDEDVSLTAPDADVFEAAEESTLGAPTEMSQWTREVIKRDREYDQIEFNEKYANSDRSDQDFKKAFGISNKTGGKTINIDESMTHTTAEIETLQGDIHSDYYEYSVTGNDFN